MTTERTRNRLRAVYGRLDAAGAESVALEVKPKVVKQRRDGVM